VARFKAHLDLVGYIECITNQKPTTTTSTANAKSGEATLDSVFILSVAITFQWFRTAISRQLARSQP
jgi:hypothetical protein